MAFNILPTGMSFQRLGKFPLDSSAIHNTLAEAMDYVKNNPTAYPGQILYIADARTEEEIQAGMEPHEALHMVTANKELKLVVSKKDLDMNEMVQEVENKVAELQGNLEQQQEEMQQAMDNMQQVADEVHADLENALKEQEEANNAKIEEMQKIADEVHEELAANNDAVKAELQQAMADEHEAMRKEAEEKHAAMEQAVADMKAEMEEEHAAMQQAAEAKHEEMKAEAEAEHKAVRELVDIEEPYMADIAAYPTSKFIFACGHPMTVEPNRGQKFDAEKPEDAVAFVYRWAEGFKAIVVEKEEAEKVHLIGGHGINKINVKRPIPQTNILVRDVKIKGVTGGSYFEGMVGHANIVLENAEIANIMGGGWCGASVDGAATRMNIVDEVNVKAKNVKGLSLVFGGAQGNGVVNDVHMEMENCEIGWLTAGGSNGMTRNAEVIVNGGNVKVAQSTNRGVVHKAKFVMNDGVVEKLYFGGETEDNSVDGLIEDGFVELNGGRVKEFNFGTNNGEELKAEDIKGSLRDCIVEAGDVSMLEQFNHMFFGGDDKNVPCADGAEVMALAGKERVDAKEAMFVVPAGSQRVVVAVPKDVEVKEIQYMGQGCADYKDMFDEEIMLVEDKEYKVMVYIFAIPCSAKMTFKIVL